MSLRLVERTGRYVDWTVAQLAQEWDTCLTDCEAAGCTDAQRDMLVQQQTSLEQALAAAEATSFNEVLAKMEVYVRDLEPDIGPDARTEDLLPVSILRDLRRLVAERGPFSVP